PTRLAPTRTARGSTKRTSRCRWCCSGKMMGCTGSGRSRRPQTGSSCALLVSVEVTQQLESWDGRRGRCLGSGTSGWDADSRSVSPEPLSEPEIVGNSSVKEGGNTKLVCNVLEGKADLYWWKKNGELLLGSNHIQFIDNNTLRILKASINDSGYYTCVIRNEVSQNETSFLLHVQSKWGWLPGAQEKKWGKLAPNPVSSHPVL
ncbi:NEO1 protein, partial [Podargus strigoides]|nr:NEO1 protein [Podargus strigoides]